MSFLLSDDLGDAVRRRLREVGGLALIALTVAAVAALATWSVRDPSFSHATSAPVHNLLGLPGAVTADLMMQLIGLASIALIAPIAAWGFRLLTHGLLCREPLRLGLWIIGTVLAAGFVACLPRTVGWPLPTGLGGVVGDLVLR
ncbi:MAG: DNA translocase FtsK 4TM domain-containing protein, partial [Xanthobacteraceae bacterium]